MQLITLIFSCLNFNFTGATNKIYVMIPESEVHGHYIGGN